MRYICTSIVATLVLAGTSFAATINVPADYTTIQAAVDAASDGDEVIVAPGTYFGSGNEVVNTLGKAITIKASGTPEETILDGQGARRGVRCTNGEGADTVIEGFTITGGSAYYGAGIYCDSGSSPTISNCTISDNTVVEGLGGGIYCSGGSPTISGCTITDNTANYYGGGIACGNSSPIITGCTITNNTASSAFEALGGGIYCSSSSPTITDCTISGNTATSKGGGIFCNYSNSAITDCTISGNISGGLGGGLHIANGSLMSIIQDTSICSNVPAESQVFGVYTDNGGNTIAEVCPWYQGACCTGNDLACVVATEEDCEYFGLTWLGEGTTCDDSPCPIACLGDVTGDGEVSVNDLLTVIANWGPCP